MREMTLYSPQEGLDNQYKSHYNILVYRGMAKFGIALGSGPRGRGFESRYSDHAECPYGI